MANITPVFCSKLKGVCGMDDINNSEVKQSIDYLNLSPTNGAFSYRCANEHIYGELTHG
ncbi:hypothetical protein [Enterococcus mundtii]|uniref:hypothetical protein n=1 Tax=Enterococcus mundtii TaxID=53346 RepID=UPI0015E758C9|nr:hypothetical protein [Enterococcus mundtii]